MKLNQAAVIDMLHWLFNGHAADRTTLQDQATLKHPHSTPNQWRAILTPYRIKTQLLPHHPLRKQLTSERESGLSACHVIHGSHKNCSCRTSTYSQNLYFVSKTKTRNWGLQNKHL